MEKAEHTARAVVQGKVNSPRQGRVQMHKSRAKGKNKGVAACQGNRAIIRTKAKLRTKAEKQQARPIAQGKSNCQDILFLHERFSGLLQAQARAITGVNYNIALKFLGNASLNYVRCLCPHN